MVSWRSRLSLTEGLKVFLLGLELGLYKPSRRVDPALEMLLNCFADKFFVFLFHFLQFIFEHVLHHLHLICKHKLHLFHFAKISVVLSNYFTRSSSYV